MTYVPELAAFAQIVLIDISLAGDNAVTVGMVAARLPTAQRHRAVLIGIVAATIFRILFAVFAVQILQITGLLVAGGLLLLWVAWKLYKDIRGNNLAHENFVQMPIKKMSTAILQIVIADVSMSLDNMLAVAGVARDHILVLIAGLALSVWLMAAASTLITRITQRYPMIAYAGLAVVVYTALRMMWDGVPGFLSVF